MDTQTLDIVVIGHGPAGLAISAECAEQGLRTLCVGPDPDGPWDAVYALWPDPIEGLDLGDCVEHRWEDSIAILDGQRTHGLGSPYVKLHNGRLRGHLRTRLERAGGAMREARVQSLEHHAQGSTVRLQGDGSLHCRLVIDASGARSRFLERAPFRGRETLQTTYGYMGRVKGHPFDPARMVLMDYRDDWMRGPELTPEVPSFLYAMPLPDGRFFAEETSVVAYHKIPDGVMKARLQARLDSLGVVYEEIEFVEKGAICMASPLPRKGQRVVGYGSAANMIHPATAWQVGLALTTAPALARTLAGALSAPDASPERAARLGWDVVWPLSRRLACAFHTMGGSILADTTMHLQREFMDAFFTAAGDKWGPFATWQLGPLQMPLALSPIYKAASSELRQFMMQASRRYGGTMLRDWMTTLAESLGRPSAQPSG